MLMNKGRQQETIHKQSKPWTVHQRSWAFMKISSFLKILTPKFLGKKIKNVHIQ